MSSSVPTTAQPDLLDFPHDSLSQLELRIARRADELARIPGRREQRDFWIEAEREVLGVEPKTVTAS
jgi:hypothetical protein